MLHAADQTQTPYTSNQSCWFCNNLHGGCFCRRQVTVADQLPCGADWLPQQPGHQAYSMVKNCGRCPAIGMITAYPNLKWESLL
jgi:hypothetical protein